MCRKNAERTASPAAANTALSRENTSCAPSAQPGIPHDPKAAKLYPEIMGHAGLFSTQGDMVKFAQGVLRQQVISKKAIPRHGAQPHGLPPRRRTYQQYLGALCYVKHPVQYFSEIPRLRE